MPNFRWIGLIMSTFAASFERMYKDEEMYKTQLNIIKH